MERVLPFEEALGEILNAGARCSLPQAVGDVDLLAAHGRVLARSVLADRDQPPFARSTRDGYAVCSADLKPGGARLRYVGLVRAGERWTGPPLQPGEAIEIMTGAPVPEGADAILMVEHAHADANVVAPEAGRHLAVGENIVPAGAEAAAGTILVPEGRRIGTPEISLAASCGYTHLAVFGQPSVAIVATGDELVEAGQTLEPWQIRNSNSYGLASLTAAEGAVPFRLPIARDTAPSLRDRLREAGNADLILFSGGVSMGKYDLVEAVLRDANAEFVFTGALIQPGKPVVFGRLPRTTTTAPETGQQAPSPDWIPFFGLPGNPVSTEVCFRLFVAPLLRALAGATERAPRFAEASLAEEIRAGARVTRFLPAVLTGSWSGVTIRPVPWQGSGDLAANARANAFVVLPPKVVSFATGDRVRVLLR